MAHAHVQSLLAGWPLRAGLVRRGARGLLAASRPEIVDCGAGVRLLGYRSVPASPSRGLAIMLHGWEGSADAAYVLSVGARLFERGYEVFRLNFRDHGETHALNEELFHSCRIDEVVGAVRAVAERTGPGRTFLIGYSLGGNFALRVAARAPAAGIRLDRVIAVCPVLSPHSTMRALEEGLWIYREYFLRRWRRSLLAKAAAFPHLYTFGVGDLRRFPTLTATTDFFVRQYTTFPDLDAYLAGYSITGAALANLSVPTRLIVAADDPIIPIRDLDDVAVTPSLDVTVLPQGGHCAFLESYRLRSWLDREVARDVEEAT
ncbi:MAG TPA: alpha/beta fold hydrolase [Gammaproteobacteria bacterium]